jgi:uncharacterized protein
LVLMRRKFSVRPFDVFLLIVIGLMAGILISNGIEIAQTNAKVLPYAGYTVSMSVPAVDNAGHGVATSLTVETKKGTGKTLANIDVLLFWVDTQQSIQTAKSAAKEITGVNTDSIDLIYAIDAGNTSLVGGPSAGAALTIATIGALKGKQPSHDVMITGTINDDDSIGPVGGVLEKAKAAKAVGAKLFLVPVGESTDTVVEPQENCTKESGFVYCEKTYNKRVVNIGEEVGIEVKEVSDVRQAVPYFFA